MSTIFITGASSGIRKARAKLFASRNLNVIATMRSPEKGKRADTIEKCSDISFGCDKERTGSSDNKRSNCKI